MTVWILLGVLVLVVLAVIYGISTYNKLVGEQLKVDNQWSQVDIVLKQRNDTIPGLVKVVSGYATHEKEVFESVTQARNNYMHAGNTTDSIRAASELSGAMNRLIAVAENYPELKANENFIDLQQKIADLENKIADFRQFYNDTVMRYNRLVRMFPSSLIAGIAHFKPRDFFEVNEAEKENPPINL